MGDYKDVLARLATQMNTRIATETDSPEKNVLKKKYGRIFQTNHCSLRLAERGLEIARDDVRQRLLDLERSNAVLFHEESNTFIPIKPERKRDWLAITAYSVKGLEAARRKAKEKGAQLLVF